MHDLNETQKKLKQQGYVVKPSRAGLGFVPFEPIKISAKTKKTKVIRSQLVYQLIHVLSMVPNNDAI